MSRDSYTEQLEDTVVMNHPKLVLLLNLTAT